jgi:hypothetical protein
VIEKALSLELRSVFRKKNISFLTGKMNLTRRGREARCFGGNANAMKTNAFHRQKRDTFHTKAFLSRKLQLCHLHAVVLFIGLWFGCFLGKAQSFVPNLPRTAGNYGIRYKPALGYHRLTKCFASHPQRSCLEFTDPETGCEVVLVGCFHGSPSSAADVEREILAKQTDAIALELCATRFADLRKMMLKTPQSAAPQPLDPSRLLRFFQLVRVTIRERGLSTGFATFILGSVSGLQTALSGFTPGLEFRTALELSQDCKHDCDLVLADQAVDETIEKVGKWPSIVSSMLSEITSGTAPSLDESKWGDAAKALSIALGGDSSLRPDYQVVVPQVMTRNSVVVQELLRLLIPPVLATQLTLNIVNTVLFPVLDGNIESSLSYATADTTATSVMLTTSLAMDATAMNGGGFVDPARWCLDMLPHAALLTFFLTTAYALLAVPVTQLILAERDEQLTRGIQAACRLVSEKRGEKGRVVAVLCLLHVNGVAQRMLQGSSVASRGGLASERISEEL